jgi:hypothetical protein
MPIVAVIHVLVHIRLVLAFHAVVGLILALLG